MVPVQAHSAYNLLLTKLDDFIRKYYKNQLLRGLIYSFGALTAFYLITSGLEYFGQFGTTGRAILFYSYLGSALLILWRFILVPLAGLFRLGKSMSHEMAAEIVGRHFSDIRDKVINTLQLHQKLDQDDPAAALIMASIQQRMQDLRPIPFTAAIDFSQNLRYLRWAVLPFLALLLLWWALPGWITDSSKRILAYNETFEPVAPFQFVIENGSMETPAQQDFELQVKTTGAEIPDQVFIDIDGSKFRLDKKDKLHFSYVFRNVQRDVQFRFYADGFYSRPHTLKALPNPVLNQFSVELDYPAYTGKKDEKVNNAGDLNIPAGTRVRWNFKTSNTDKLQLQFADTAMNANAAGGGFTFDRSFVKDSRYRVKTSNAFIQGKDQVEYGIQVIPDAYPGIQVMEKSDSISRSQFFFKGEMEDDYGFSSLQFHVVRRNQNEEVSHQKQEIPFNRNFIRNTFFWTANFSDYQLLPGEEVEYWFEVRDNDGVNGPKAARSQRSVFRAPTLDEMHQAMEQNSNAVKSDLKETLMDARQIQKDLDELNKRLLEKKELNWQDKKKAQELIDKQQQLEQKIENLKKENELNNMKREEFRKSDQEMLEKQQQLEKLFDQIMSEEMKEKLKQLEELMEKLNKDELQQEMKKLKQDNQDLEKELDRTLELFKQLELEQKMEAAMDKLDALQKKQEELAEKSAEKNANEQEIKKAQDQLNAEFQELRKELDDAEKKNQQLEEPMDLPKTDALEEEIQKEMENSSNQLQQNKSSKASQSQKNASSKMQQMKDSMEQQMAQSESESMEQDASKLREILENLLQLSFDQERLMKTLNRTAVVNPLYVTIAADQKRIKDEARAIEDSLFALSKRVPQIEAIINREVGKVNQELEATIGYLANRDSRSAANRQQRAMTSINNLALLLSEVSDQMQQQLAQQQQQKKQGNGSCSKPGQNKKPGKGKPKPSLSTMRQLQEQLNEQMKQMKEGMQKPGGMKGKQSSESLAKMAAQQEMLRNEMQRLMNEMQKEGDQGNTGALKNIINKMEQTETDIVNKNITSETLRRQQEIMTKLLEAEKAERERDQDDKRESNENKNDYKRNLQLYDQYNKLVTQEAEMLKTLPPSLKPFYKNRVKAYFNSTN